MSASSALAMMRPRSCGIQAAIGRRLHQYVRIGEIAAISEIQFHQSLLHLGGFALGLGPVNQPMAIDRVGLALDQVRAIAEAFFIGSGNDAPGNSLVCIDRAEFRGEVFLAADAFTWDPGIEKERAPVNIDRNIGGELQCLLDAAFADITPRANHIGNDVDLKRL